MIKSSASNIYRSTVRKFFPAIGFLVLFSLQAFAGTTIQFWAVTSSFDDVQMFRDLADDFEKETGIGVEITPLSWGNFASKYFTAMAAGLPPDIGVTNNGGPVDYGSMGGLVDFREEFPEEIGGFERCFFPKLLPQYTFKDKLFGIPTDVTTLMLYYRTDIFENLGIQPPETWSEFLDTIHQLEKAGYHYGFAWTRLAQWALSLYTKPYGLDAFEQTTTGEFKIHYTDPDYIKGVAFAMELWHMHDLADPNLGDKYIGLFNESDPSLALPLLVDLSYIHTKIPQIATGIEGKWAVIPWPKADQGEPYNVMGGTAYVIFKKSKHKRESFEWLKFLNRVEVQQRIVLSRLDRKEESFFTVSPVRAIWSPEHADFWKRPELAKSRDLQQAMATVVPTFDTVPPIRGSSEAGRFESNLLDRMGTSIVSRLNSIAASHGLSRWELIQDFARGKYVQDKKDLDQWVKDNLREEYEKIAPRAREILMRETAHYDQRYGGILDDLSYYEKKKDILFYMETGIVLILLGLTGWVLFNIRLRKSLISYLFIAPPLVSVLVFVFIPALVALYLSFSEYHPVLPLSAARWVGLRQYLYLISSGELFGSFWKTLFYVVGVLPIQLFLSLCLAALLNQAFWGQRFWRTLYFSPMVTSVISISLIFTLLFQGSSQGWINSLLLKLGITENAIIFLTTEGTFLYCVMILSLWAGLAFNILIYLAGLQQIPVQLYEAARVDGAGGLRRFWHISIPSLRPQIYFTIIMGLIWGFQVFEPIYMLSGGMGQPGSKFGPNDAGMTMVPLIYQTGFEDFKMGRSAAAAYVLFAIILVFTLVQSKWYQGKVEA